MIYAKYNWQQWQTWSLIKKDHSPTHLPLIIAFMMMDPIYGTSTYYMYVYAVVGDNNNKQSRAEQWSGVCREGGWLTRRWEVNSWIENTRLLVRWTIYNICRLSHYKKNNKYRKMWRRHEVGQRLKMNRGFITTTATTITNKSRLTSTPLCWHCFGSRTVMGNVITRVRIRLWHWR